MIELEGLEEVEGALKRLFDEAKLRANVVGSGYLGLWETLEQGTVGGKRFRPWMVMLAYQQLGGRDVGNAALLGASFELLHTALIVHDDVIDRDFTRRGTSNVSGRYRAIAETAGCSSADAEHRGFSAGVIAGDLALSNAYRLLSRLEADTATRQRLNMILDEAIFASVAGEFLDIESSMHTDIPPLDDVIRMARLKTAVYSFEGPLQAGAVLAGADEGVIASLGDFGRDAGIAYQITDDLLGVFGNEAHTGKTNWGDLREGKRTALISYAAHCREWNRISSLIGSRRMSAADVDLVRQILVDCGAMDYSVRLATTYANRAGLHLEKEGIPTTLRSALGPVVSGMVDRVR